MAASSRWRASCAGTFADGQSVLSPGGEEKISGLSRLLGGALSKHSEALEGDTLAFGRLEHAATGDRSRAIRAGEPGGRRRSTLSRAGPGARASR